MANDTGIPSASSETPAADATEYNTWNPPKASPSQSPTPTGTKTTTIDALLYPSGSKSLSGISLRAFLLGTTLGLSTALTLTLLNITDYFNLDSDWSPHYLWRLPFFLSSLALFHFLEYYITAAHNTRYADVAAFLLSTNGWAYNVAHSSAAVECLLGYLFCPRDSYFEFTASVDGVKVQVVAGLLFMVVGQVIRSLAMAQAGSNFNHTVQVERKDGHMLVTHGIYSVLRHPSYFGFFWWGLGTQLVLGNVVCFVGYAVVLWKFFSSRIQREERFLIAFFGEEYVEYKKRTIVGIPCIA
ncbi:protein-S-isoprenylcysteine carboxyl O-methyltransferase [Aspergillus mulundensis]|uniref:Protein-S-isoprenylcysteine O-methyltransferase n=1 Tax=Aspergillus mulundensis TaxID=1810919 RepID=A0A3D8SWF3_9EURO|nr:Protein-S-isoprenylcysteine O-methyltransferase [Aspergillus mulundensis]RDW90491.1 Protein-S-isoprenylcysteine O-methyltransferase [Aspergillus mulundensis]